MFRYQGSKRLSAEEISGILKQKMKETGITNYVEPFCGSCSVALKMVDYPEIKINVNDSSKHIYVLLKDVQDKTFKMPPKIGKQEYDILRKNDDINSNKTFYGVMYGFGGTFLGSYCDVRPHGSKTHYENFYKKLFKHDISKFNITNDDYKYIVLKERSIIYCDPPYVDTNRYSYFCKFDHEEFLKKVDEWHSQGHIVFVSEQKMLDSTKYKFIFEKQIKSNICNVAKVNLEKRKPRTEYLFERINI